VRMADETDVAGLQRFWRLYVLGLAGVCLFAALFGQFFSPLALAENVTAAVLNRMLAIALVALVVDRATEVYVASWRRLGDERINELLEEAREALPDSAAAMRRLKRERAHYRMQTRRIRFLVALLLGVLVACVGLRVLDGVITIDRYWIENPAWQTRVWFAVDILLTGGVIGGGAAGIHDIIKTLSGQFRPG